MITPAMVKMAAVNAALLVISIVLLRFAIKSGVIHLMGIPVRRKREPVQFWGMLALVFVPLLAISMFFIVLILRSVLSA